MVQKCQRQTCENIVNKLNMKNYGLNYEPQIEACAKKFGLERQLKLAMKEEGQDLDLRSLDPSVAGICANMAENPHSIVGDYFYQESCSEQLDLEQLVSRTQWILRTLKKNRPKNCRPPCIVVLRDGLSEGQFSMVCKLELDAIRTGCRRFDYPKFILPCRFNRILFAASYTTQGTGKPIEYSILENEVNASQDELHAFLMSLSYIPIKL